MAGSQRLVELDTAQLAAALAGFADRAEDLSEPMSVIAESLVTAVQDKFEQSGPGWPDLAESTKQQRRGSEYQILVDTGVLSGSIAGESGKDFAEVGTSVEYAKYHVSAEPRTKIPLRDFFDLPDDVYEDAADTILAHIAG
jgi:phage gpG-like protein